MALKKGVCKNFQNCTLADKDEIQEVDSSEFRCAECGKALYVITGEGHGFHISKRLVFIIVAAIILIGGGIGAYWVFIRDTNNVRTEVSLSLNEEEINLCVGDSATLVATLTPNMSQVSISWLSRNEEVATVTDGIVKTKTAGKTLIIVVAQTETGEVRDTCVCSVFSNCKSGVEPSDSVPMCSSDILDIGEQAPAVKGTGSNAIANIGGKAVPAIEYGVWTGQFKNNQPDGTGTMTYKTRHRIDPRDVKERVAEAGDYIIGEFSQGKLIHGVWYDKNNNQKDVLIFGK